jgi:hypothetical protein
LIANKIDCIENEVVTDNEGKELAQEINAIFCKTSAKEVSGGIEELFNDIGKKFLAQNPELIQTITKRDDSIKIDKTKTKKKKKKNFC